MCSDCHSAHSIERTDLADFRLHIMDQCGRCHEEITESYFETYHGKVSRLGYLKTAKCYDCHGAHDILPVSRPPLAAQPRQHRQDLRPVPRRARNRRFAGYLTHATHHDPAKYPFLFCTFWGMTVAAGRDADHLRPAHAGLAAALAAVPQGAEGRHHAGDGEVYVRRFQPFQRNLHLMVIFSFLGLALTGMMLKFSYATWAQVLSPRASAASRRRA